MGNVVTKFYGIGGIQKVTSEMLVIPNNIAFNDVNSGHHYDYTVINKKTGHNYKIIAAEVRKTSVYIQNSFHGVNYKGKSQKTHGDWNVIVRKHNELTPNLQAALLECKAIVTKKANVYTFYGVQLNCVKKIDWEDENAEFTFEYIPKIENGTYTCKLSEFNYSELRKLKN